MGKRPAPPWATIFFGIHERKFLSMFISMLLFLKRYIDDILGIWLAHPDPETNERLWLKFQEVVNNFHGLEWEFTKLSKKDVIFMDMSLSIIDGRVESTLYEKPLALYLYIPPHSAHPPGVLAGLVMGNVLRFFLLCTVKSDIQVKLDEFYARLLNRGHQPSTLLPLFDKAISNAASYIEKSDEDKKAAALAKIEAAQRSVYFHLTYHPNDPPSRTIQRLWREFVAEPMDGLPLNKMENLQGFEIPVDKLTIAYHRAPNLGNLLSYRKIDKRTGPKVSSFVKD